MQVETLEKALRLASAQASPRAAIASIAADAHANALPAEFVAAIHTLLYRKRRPGQRSILEDISAAWT